MQDQERAILKWIGEEWRSLPLGFAPGAVWIRRYPPVPIELGDINDNAMFPQAVWFLSNSGLRCESIWKWKRFSVVHSQQHWCRRTVIELNPIFGKTHEIGFAAFAPCEGTDMFYIDTVWGGTFGSGWHATVENGMVQLKRRLWVS